MLAGTGASSGPTTECPPVDVPVILDAVRYESAEFNDLQSELCGKVDLIYTVNPQNGDLHAFTAKERFNEWAAKKGLPAFDDAAIEGGMGPILTRDGDTIVCAPTDSAEECQSRVDQEDATKSQSNVEPLQVCPPPSSYYSKNWEHNNCGGWSLWVAPRTSIADLRNVGGYNWNDRISSVQAATGVYYESVFEHINFKGDVFVAWAGYTYPDLRAYGWNDRGSSLKTVGG